MRWMNLKTIIQSEASQEVKKSISYMNVYIWNLEESIDEPIYKEMKMQT